MISLSQSQCQSIGAWIPNDIEEACKLVLAFGRRPFAFCMGNVCFKGKGARLGELVVVAHGPDLAPRFAEDSTLQRASLSGGDEVLASTSGVLAPSCESLYFSPRIYGMIASKSKGEFESELEFETTHSKVHWSELSHREGASSSGESIVDHCQHFEALQKDAHWGFFCSQVKDVVLGRKLGEGAQGDIYEAQVLFVNGNIKLGRKMGDYDLSGYVVKVMKGECALEDLQCQWPRGMANVNYERFHGDSKVFKMCGALVEESTTKRSKFGFVMNRHWGDLCKLIDLRMIRKNAKGPPFSVGQALYTIYCIAAAMMELHKGGITHRDLKAANVLVSKFGRLDWNVMEIDLMTSDDSEFIFPYVDDWECSVGIVGTGFWRAPQILQQLKNGLPSSELVFNEKTDIYSFGMTCYEIVTGLMPFEDSCLLVYETRDAILDHGLRPQLPDDLDPMTSAMITSCWDQDPSLRPRFLEVVNLMFDKVFTFLGLHSY